MLDNRFGARCGPCDRSLPLHPLSTRMPALARPSSRYIHVGHLSEGCVTVHQLEKWSALYEFLISHRVANSAGKRIGSLEVRR